MENRKGFIGAIIIAFVLIFGLIGTVLCIERVPVGYEGIVYSMSNGVTGETLTQGWHIVAPSKKVKLFSISNSQLILTKDKRENSEDDESFRVASADNASIAISFQMSYRFDEKRIVDTYKAYKMDGDAIIENRVKTVLKSRVSEVTTDYSLMDIYSGNRSEINDKLTKYLNEKFSKQFGVEVIDASIIDVHPDKKLSQAINNRIEAQQKADQAKAEQKTAQVEAETAMIKAKNEADIKIKKAEAEAKANKMIADSITDELIKMEEVEARKKHGWVTIQGANSIIKED